MVTRDSFRLMNMEPRKPAGGLHSFPPMSDMMMQVPRRPRQVAAPQFDLMSMAGPSPSGVQSLPPMSDMMMQVPQRPAATSLGRASTGGLHGLPSMDELMMKVPARKGKKAAAPMRVVPAAVKQKAVQDTLSGLTPSLAEIKHLGNVLRPGAGEGEEPTLRSAENDQWAGIADPTLDQGQIAGLRGVAQAVAPVGQPVVGNMAVPAVMRNDDPAAPPVRAVLRNDAPAAPPTRLGARRDYASDNPYLDQSNIVRLAEAAPSAPVAEDPRGPLLPGDWESPLTGVRGSEVLAEGDRRNRKLDKQASGGGVSNLSSGQQRVNPVGLMGGGVTDEDRALVRRSPYTGRWGEELVQPTDLDRERAISGLERGFGSTRRIGADGQEDGGWVGSSANGPGLTPSQRREAVSLIRAGRPVPDRLLTGNEGEEDRLRRAAFREDRARLAREERMNSPAGMRAIMKGMARRNRMGLGPAPTLGNAMALAGNEEAQQAAILGARGLAAVRGEEARANAALRGQEAIAKGGVEQARIAAQGRLDVQEAINRGKLEAQRLINAQPGITPEHIAYALASNPNIPQEAIPQIMAMVAGPTGGAQESGVAGVLGRAPARVSPPAPLPEGASPEQVAAHRDQTLDYLNAKVETRPLSRWEEEVENFKKQRGVPYTPPKDPEYIGSMRTR